MLYVTTTYKDSIMIFTDRLHASRFLCVIIILLGLAIVAPAISHAKTPYRQPDQTADLATQALDARIDMLMAETGVRGGMVVSVGCNDGDEAVGFGRVGTFTYQGLSSSQLVVDQMRETIRRSKLYGEVSVVQHDRATLPYVDGSVNLLIVEKTAGKLAQVPREEMMRELAPGGKLMLRNGDTPVAVTKPRPDDIDEWTHFLHDASNDGTARDRQVGPPRRLQWLAPPLWLRSHETPSGIQAAVTGGGRIFYIFDQGLVGITDERIPDRWALIGRDAFNGRKLWERKLRGWGWRQWDYEKYAGKDWTKLRAARTNVPNDNQRRLVVEGDRVCATLGFREPVEILDAADGRTLAVLKGTEDARELMVSDGTLVVYICDRSIAADKRRGGDGEITSRLMGFDVTSGKRLWSADVDPIRALYLAAADGRVVYSGGGLACRDLKTGKLLWNRNKITGGFQTLLIADSTVLLSGGSMIAAYDLPDGKELWSKKLYRPSGVESMDIFISDGMAWRGVASLPSVEAGKKKTLQTTGKSPHLAAIGIDIRTGEERKRIIVGDLRSPEHHHRCYRNKATERYIMTAMEGIEMVDLRGEKHSQNNWLRGACKYGVMPANGMIYVPPDQCFCQPGAKLLGFTAVKSEGEIVALPESQRLERGPAWGCPLTAKTDVADWPTYRGDTARSGRGDGTVGDSLNVVWEARLTGRLTQPVVANGLLLIASKDAHTVNAIDAETGKQLWSFTADGRIDSPPTLWRGLALLGSADGRVYCLRASDGALVWRRIVAPNLQRLGSYDQFESAWPVHGSVLVYNDGGHDTPTAYVTAGRSTYLDGGIRVFGLDPVTGNVRYRTVIEGPFPGEQLDEREVSFYVQGANSDVLVAQGGFLYMRQKKLTPQLKQVDCEILSSKGESDVGLHLFATSGLLDDSAYNRAFWMYSVRWPGFQLAYQAPKTGQMLAVDGDRTYGVKYFYRRNCHSGMFFPEREGYLLFADSSDSEPQIVGDKDAREPIPWLPQSEYFYRTGSQPRKLDSMAFGTDKLMGYTRADPVLWTTWLPIRVRAMAVADGRILAAGPPDVLDKEDPYAPFEGKRGWRLALVDSRTGKVTAKKNETELPPAPPVFDGLITAGGKVYVALEDGKVICLEGE